MKTATDDEFARAFAPLLEVLQNGVMRPATPADVLELLGSGGPRYILKRDDGMYLAKEGKGFSRKQRDAEAIPDRECARELCAMGLRDYGVKTKVVRIRRKGTARLEAVRLRPGLDIHREGGELSFFVSRPEAMTILAALTGAKKEEAEQ